MITNAIAYHPTVSHYLRYIATTVGRDKLLRTLQYFARFYAWYLYRTERPSVAIAPFEATKKQLGLVRKVLRTGKFVEHFRAAAVAADAYADAAKAAGTMMDPVLRFCAVGRQLGYGVYLGLDMLTVPDALGIRKSASAQKIQREAYRAWMGGLLFSIMASVYTLTQLRAKAAALEKRRDGESAVEAKKTERERTATKIQLLSDTCDIAIPASALGYVALDDGIVGLAGTLSSLIGVWTTWKKTA